MLRDKSFSSSCANYSPLSSKHLSLASNSNSSFYLLFVHFATKYSSCFCASIALHDLSFDCSTSALCLASVHALLLCKASHLMRARSASDHKSFTNLFLLIKSSPCSLTLETSSLSASFKLSFSVHSFFAFISFLSTLRTNQFFIFFFALIVSLHALHFHHYHLHSTHHVHCCSCLLHFFCYFSCQNAQLVQALLIFPILHSLSSLFSHFCLFHFFCNYLCTFFIYFF